MISARFYLLDMPLMNTINMAYISTIPQLLTRQEIRYAKNLDRLHIGDRYFMRKLPVFEIFNVKLLDVYPKRFKVNQG